MKIRWTQGNVRFRITPSELAALEQGEALQEVLGVGETASWSAEIVPQSAATGIYMLPGRVRVTLSAVDGLRLAAPDVEGVYFQQQGEPGLRYYIEKDFPCAHPRATEANEPPTETFEAPAGFEARKSAPLPTCTPETPE